MRHFEIVPRSIEKNRRPGPKGGPPNVRYDQSGRLSFSKLAAVVFEPHALCIVGYDREAKELCFTAVDKPPAGYTEAACYGINWINSKKNGHSHCIVAARSLFQKIGFSSEANFDFPVLNLDAESHSIIVAIPAIAETTATQEAPAALPATRPNGGEHAAV